MPAPRPDIANLLEVAIPPGGKVITASDLHLPPVRTDVSGRSCETLARHLDDEPGPLTVVLAGDVVELLGFPALVVFFIKVPPVTKQYSGRPDASQQFARANPSKPRKRRDTRAARERSS